MQSVHQMCLNNTFKLYVAHVLSLRFKINIDIREEKTSSHIHDAMFACVIIFLEVSIWAGSFRTFLGFLPPGRYTSLNQIIVRFVWLCFVYSKHAELSSSNPQPVAAADDDYWKVCRFHSHCPGETFWECSFSSEVNFFPIVASATDRTNCSDCKTRQQQK